MAPLTVRSEEVRELLDGKAGFADQRPEGPFRQGRVVRQDEPPVRWVDSTEDEVASLLPIQLIAGPPKGTEGLLC